MNKTILAIGIIILFIGMSFNSISGIQIQNKPVCISSNRGNTLYVGGSGPNNYTKIQDAIDDASDGDSVFVYDDSSPYYENIVVDKSIDLIGENRETTIIDGQNMTGYDTITIYAHYVNISGFSIQHCGTLMGDAGIEICKNYCIITDNIITLNEDNGILISYSNNNTISGNIITQNQGDWYHGVCLISSDGNIFIDNNIYNNGYGFSIHHSDNNTIKNNFIHDNYNEEGNFGAGIWLEYCNYNFIIYNNISNNSGRGIDLYNCYYNNIYNNSIIGNGWGTLPGTVGADGICLRVGSKNNIIQKNIIKSNIRDGISFHDGSGSTSNNLIIENNIEANNRRGIEYSGSGALNNIIYHNNFFNNPVNGYDEGTNIWDNDYPSGGNYWDDYTGEDKDGDGIGDTPYPITGGNNKDRYPLMEPWVDENQPPDIPEIFEENGSLFVCTTDPDEDTVMYIVDWGDGTTTETDYYPSGQKVELIHEWPEPGIYYIRVKAQDEHGAYSNWSETYEIRIGNNPPDTPIIYGPSNGKPGIDYKYCINASDPDNDSLFVLWRWGDGTNGEWLGPIVSGMEVCDSHSWNETGIFTISVTVIDEYGESVKAYKEVRMPRDKSVSISPWLRFLERYPLLNRLLNILVYTVFL